MSDGGPAYPTLLSLLERQRRSEADRFTYDATTLSGKSLRDDFAGQALMGLLNSPGDTVDADSLARSAYVIGQAMVCAKQNWDLSDGDPWMGIESAPIDGSRVLLWNRSWTGVCTGQYYPDKGWGVDVDVARFKHQPTHWLPAYNIPAPPSERDLPSSVLKVEFVPSRNGALCVAEETCRARVNAARLDALREAEIAVLKTVLISLSTNPGVLAREIVEEIRRLRNV